MSRYLVYPVLTEENKIIVYFHYFKIKLIFNIFKLRQNAKNFFLKFSFALLKEKQFVLTFSQPEGHKTSLYYFQFYD